MTTVATFLRRARAEAERYGDDPWVFVRELIQNARDAGARRVTFTVQAQPGGGSLIEIGDDGGGMTWDHATRFLFTLYASSKATSPGAVGRFGVGFWSILRIKPAEVSICSWPARGEPWRLDLALDETRASRRTPSPAPPGQSGTRVGIRVAFPPATVCDALRDTASQTARFVRRLRDDRPIEILVDGHRVDRPFTLPSPSIHFRGRGFRGCVGFGSSASVELFARGLRVRAASSLAALLGDDPRLAVSRLKFTDLEGGLAPQIILEVDDLQLDLSRSHPLARGQLDRAIARARRETEALVAAQLEQVDPSSLRARWRELLRAPRRAALAGGLALLVALLGGGAASRLIDAPRPRASTAATARALPSPMADLASGDEEVSPYRDLAGRYLGPGAAPDGVAAARHRLPLRYRPEEASLHLALLRVPGDPFAPPPVKLDPAGLRPAEVARCDRDCVELSVEVALPAGISRVPIPSGTRLVAESGRWDDGTVPTLGELPDGMPAVILAEARRGTLRYQASPAAGMPARMPAEMPAGMPAGSLDAHGTSLPPDLERAAVSLRRRVPEARVRQLTSMVQERVRYDLSRETALAHARLTEAGWAPLARVLEVGAGDCDLQNAVLTRLLQAANLDARLVIGHEARNGRPSGVLHAWVEWRADAGPWQVADASPSTLPAEPNTASTRAVTSELAAASAARPLAGPPSPTSPAPASREVASSGPAASSLVPGSAGAPSRDAAAPPRGVVARDPAGGFPSTRQRWGLALLAVSLLGLVAPWRRRARAEIEADPENVVRLLQGALARPRLLRELPMLATRPLIRTLSGRRISLARCRALAQRRRLFSGRSHDAVSWRPSRNIDVLDLDSDTGELFARSQGIPDLDAWAALMREARTPPAVQRVQQAIARVLPCRVGLTTALPAGVDCLDRRALGIRGSDSIWLALDPIDPRVRQALLDAETRPARAELELLTLCVAELPLDSHRRAELVATAASRALLAIQGGDL